MESAKLTFLIYVLVRIRSVNVEQMVYVEDLETQEIHVEPVQIANLVFAKTMSATVYQLETIVQLLVLAVLDSHALTMLNT